MHTTAVLLAIDFVDHTALWAHAGDSRLYWFRDGAIVTRTREGRRTTYTIDVEKFRAFLTSLLFGGFPGIIGQAVTAIVNVAPDAAEVKLVVQHKPGAVAVVCTL